MKRLLIVLLLLSLVPTLVLLRNEAARGALVELLEGMREAGPRGAALFFVLEMAAGVLLLPIWLMAGVAGYVYGFPRGVLVAVPGVVVAGLSGFSVARWLFARGLSPDFVRGAYWQAVRRATEHEGLKIATLLRLTPVVPQNLLHYLLASTGLPARRFALGTLAGLLPVTTLQVYVGSLVKSAATLVAGEAQLGGPLRWAAPAAGLVASLVAGGLVARAGKKALEQTLASATRETPRSAEAGEGGSRGGH